MAETYNFGNTGGDQKGLDNFTDFSVVDSNGTVTKDGNIKSIKYYARNTNKFQFFAIDSKSNVLWVSGDRTPMKMGENYFFPEKNETITLPVGAKIGLHFESSGTIPFASGEGAPASYTMSNVGKPVVGEFLGFADSAARKYSFVVEIETK